MADPVTFAEARLHLRLPSGVDSDEQTEIERMISVATEYAESFTNRAWTTGSKTVYFDVFPVRHHRDKLGLYLPGGKITSITYGLCPADAGEFKVSASRRDRQGFSLPGNG